MNWNCDPRYSSSYQKRSKLSPSQMDVLCHALFQVGYSLVKIPHRIGGILRRGLRCGRTYPSKKETRQFSRQNHERSLSRTPADFIVVSPGISGSIDGIRRASWQTQDRLSFENRITKQKRLHILRNALTVPMHLNIAIYTCRAGIVSPAVPLFFQTLVFETALKPEWSKRSVQPTRPDLKGEKQIFRVPEAIAMASGSRLTRFGKRPRRYQAWLPDPWGMYFGHESSLRVRQNESDLQPVSKPSLRQLVSQ